MLAEYLFHKFKYFYLNYNIEYNLLNQDGIFYLTLLNIQNLK